MKIAIGSDHAGFRYKERIKEFLQEQGHVVNDFGTFSEEPVDYPLFIRPVAEAVARGGYERGIVLGGKYRGPCDGSHYGQTDGLAFSLASGVQFE